ncbi:MAG: tetratricopeptide repeat protein [Terriglobia bacterium]|nr:tetratricopeptide repeat protein [Terriglobia bacterium]
MTFWNVANGRPSDLIPIKDPSKIAAVAENVGGMLGGSGLAVGGAFLFLAGLAPLYPAGLLAMKGVQHASRSARSIPDALEAVENARSEAAAARRLQAIRYYERALDIDPRNHVILSRVAFTYAAVGKLEDATAAIDRALEFCPDNHLYWLAKGTISLAIADLSGARKCFERASTLNPTDPDTWSNLGLVCEQLSDLTTAQRCWESLLGLAPENPSAWINRGELAYLLGNTAEGVKSWIKACELDPSITPKWVLEYEIGATSFSRGDLNSADTHYDNAIALNPTYAQPWIGKALCGRKRGDLRAGLGFLDKALELDGKNANVWFNRGNFLSELKQEEDAKLAWEQAFLIDPTVRVPWVISFDEGLKFLNIAQAQTAVPYFYKATSLYPAFAEGWFRKGVAHRALGQDQEARQCWRRCLEVKSDHALAQLNLGSLEFEAGNRIGAMELWEKALGANEKLSQAAMNKGAALADAGQLQDAMEYFSKALAAGHPRAGDALQLAQRYEKMDPTAGPLP